MSCYLNKIDSVRKASASARSAISLKCCKMFTFPCPDNPESPETAKQKLKVVETLIYM